MRNVTRFAATLAAALVVGGCGSGSTDDVSKSPQGSAETTTASTAGTTTTTTTAAVETTTTTTEPVDLGITGSRDVPIALGEYADMGDWLVRVLSVNPDAVDELLAGDGFLDPPGDGNVYFLIEMEGIYQGTGSASMWQSFFFNAVGDSNVEYDEFESDCGFIEGGLSQQGEVFPGGQVTGFECFEVSAADADTLTLYLDGLFSVRGEDRVFFAVRAGEGEATGVSPGSAGTDAGTDVGSRANPVAIGSFERIGDWFVRIDGIDLDATDRVLALDTFNDPPPDGFRYVLADVELAYAGRESSSFWLGLNWSGVGPSNVAVDTFDASCGTLGGALDSGYDFYPNGRATGPLCLTVAEDQIDEFVLFFDTFGEERRFFAIHPGVGTATDVAVETIDIDLGTAEGTPGNPITFGTEARVADWDVTVVGFNPDAADEVVAESTFNDPPAAGNVYVLIDLQGTYRGDDSSTLWADTTWSLLLPTNVGVSGFDASCGSIPDDLSFADEAFEGGTITGSICFEVPSGFVDQLTLVLEDFTTFDDEGTVFFDLS